MQLVIGNKNYSSWSLRPWLLLRANNIEFTEVNVSLNQSNLRDRLLEYSAVAKVPVLIDHDIKIWDSLAICEYISDTYLAGLGWPGDATDKAIARSVCAEMHSGYSSLRAEMPMNCRAKRKVEISNATKMDIERIDEIFTTYSRKSADGSLCLFGKFSIADCFYAPVALRFETYDIKLSVESDQYVQSILHHPSVKEWVLSARNESEIVPLNEVGI